MVTRLTDAICLAGDFSGLQRFVLRVKTAGKAQAKRLRARSFLLEVLEHAALWVIQKNLGVCDEDILVRGGDGFLVRISSAANPAQINELTKDLQRKLWSQFGGQVQLAVGWAATVVEARARLERRKRTPATAVLKRDGIWDVGHWSQPPLDEPCEVCREFPGRQAVRDEDDEVLHCRSCLEARRIGQEITRREWFRAGQGSLHILGVAFKLCFSPDQRQSVLNMLGQPENGTYKLGVQKLFRILEFSADKSFRKSIQVYDSLRNHLTKRNHSLLAHGLLPVRREAFRSFWGTALAAFDLVDADIPRWPKLQLKLPPIA